MRIIRILWIEAQLMVKYTTKQRQALLSYLSEHADERLSAGQIAVALEDAGVSLSAVYRNLLSMEAEGKIKRYSKAGSRDVFYQYIAAPSCLGNLHLACIKCGKTFHMNTAQASSLISQIEQTENFLIDKSDTVLYGVCKDCK